MKTFTFDGELVHFVSGFVLTKWVTTSILFRTLKNFYNIHNWSAIRLAWRTTYIGREKIEKIV